MVPVRATFFFGDAEAIPRNATTVAAAAIERSASGTRSRFTRYSSQLECGRVLERPLSPEGPPFSSRRMHQAQPRLRVEQVEMRGIERELDLLAGLHAGARGESRDERGAFDVDDDVRL